MRTPLLQISEPVGPSEKPLVVLGHSLGTGPLLWQDVVPKLAKEFRVAVLTLPGHATASPPAESFTLRELAEAVVEWVQRHHPSKFFFAGVSIGGALALELALAYPDQLLGVVSIASAASLGDAKHWDDRAKLVRAETPAVLVKSSEENWFSQETLQNLSSEVQQVLQALETTSTEGYARCAEALGQYDVSDRLTELSIPVLAIWGEFDRIAPESRQNEIIAGAPNAQKVMIRGAAHQPPMEQADATAAALQSFFAECLTLPLKN